MNVTGEAIAVANSWDQIKARLTTKISSRAYEDWVMRTVFEGADGGSLRVSVPDQVTKEWMEQEYAADVLQTIQELRLPIERVVYTPRATNAHAANISDVAHRGGSPDPVFPAPAGQLNQRYRFDNYVVRSCIQCAHPSARPVCRSRAISD